MLNSEMRIENTTIKLLYSQKICAFSEFNSRPTQPHDLAEWRITHSMINARVLKFISSIEPSSIAFPYNICWADKFNALIYTTCIFTLFDTMGNSSVERILATSHCIM